MFYDGNNGVNNEVRALTQYTINGHRILIRSCSFAEVYLLLCQQSPYKGLIRSCMRCSSPTWTCSTICKWCLVYSSSMCKLENEHEAFTYRDSQALEPKIPFDQSVLGQIPFNWLALSLLITKTTAILRYPLARIWINSVQLQHRSMYKILLSKRRCKNKYEGA